MVSGARDHGVILRATFVAGTVLDEDEPFALGGPGLKASAQLHVRCHARARRLPQHIARVRDVLAVARVRKKRHVIGLSALGITDTQ